LSCTLKNYRKEINKEERREKDKGHQRDKEKERG
jgi:hypothetical protein